MYINDVYLKHYLTILSAFLLDSNTAESNYDLHFCLLVTSNQIKYISHNFIDKLPEQDLLSLLNNIIRLS